MSLAQIFPSTTRRQDPAQGETKTLETLIYLLMLITFGTLVPAAASAQCACGTQCIDDWLTQVSAGTPSTYVETGIIVDGLVGNIVSRDIGPLTGARSLFELDREAVIPHQS